MKIWFITREFAPEYGGGIGTYVENCATMFSKNGHDVTVLVHSNVMDSVETTDEGYKVVRFKNCVGEQYEYLGFENALAYQYFQVAKRMVDEYGAPDVIEIQEFDAIGQYILQDKLTLGSTFKDIPVVIHLHSPLFVVHRINQGNTFRLPFYWIGEMEKFCIKAADALVTQSEFLANELKEYTDKEITVIPLPFNIDEDVIAKKLEETNKSPNNKKSTKQLLYMGRLEYRKGVLQMLEGVKSLWDKGHEFQLLMVGGDTYYEPMNMMMGEFIYNKYQKYIEDGHIVLKKPVPFLDLIPIVNNADGVIVPSLFENFPNTCIYSMWMKKPVIVSKSGGQAEMVQVDGENGLMFDWNIKHDFEKRIIDFLNMNDDELNEIGENGYHRIKEICSFDNNYQRRNEFFSNVIEEYKHHDNDVFPFLYEMPKQEYRESYEQVDGELSVVIPFYNLGKTLMESIDSIKASTIKPLEIVIVNDGSVDEYSLEVLNSLRNDSLIRIVDIENGGLANARNVGALEAKGEYIAFLDADDMIDPTYYEKCIAILKKYKNVSYAYSWVKLFGTSDSIFPTFNIHIPYLMCANMLSAFTVIRKNDFLNFGLNDPDMLFGLEDYDGWLKLAENGYLGVSIPEILSFYRMREGSMSKKLNPDMVNFLFRIMLRKYKKLFAKFGYEAHMLELSNGPSYNWKNPTLDINVESNNDFTIQDTINKYRLPAVYKEAIKATLKKVFSLQFYLDKLKGR